ncbi:hypothetical protein GCM10011380_18280 [Sphingomonas metalli]|uniref:DUF4173 domain-containing protein n=1 Tax=Sphingomonas metalli TaxID=1779358 RepID=A0A916T257_9SPHN|nr:DUF4173 domain-containing protein [Sphingomonas metalli]GGB29148.1 hypothetical protein GCM10011380_18280 [Sphingomonas metalli]
MRFGFWWKVAVAAMLVGLLDRIVAFEVEGIGLGMLAGGWLIGVVAARADVRRRRLAWAGLAAAAWLALSLADDPGPLAWLLFWVALSFATLAPRTTRFDDAWRWSARLAVHGLTGLFRPVIDAAALLRSQKRIRIGGRAVAATLALPAIGGTLFLLLFAAANPLIGQLLAALRLPPVWRILLWGFALLFVWASLRPHPLAIRIAHRLPEPEPLLPGTSLPSVLIALALFNALFAVQNLLDILFLWSGAPLPAGTSRAGYVHQGAYPLIVTALIAGVMALAMLRPGSPAADDRRARLLVTVWVGQNLILVASSALRTLDYIAASMLTAWRIAALVWMALVALGLLSIGWRIAKGHSARWLVNLNAGAAALVLAACAMLDLGALVAAWNVRAADPARVDLCYLRNVGDGALLPLIALEARTADPATRDGIAYIRAEMLQRLATRQADWRQWTPRGARRLSAAQAALGPRPSPPLSLPKGKTRDCNGAIVDAPWS